MTTILTQASVPTTILNQPSSRARGRIRSTGNPLLEADPISKAWQQGEPALGAMSYRQPTIHWSDITAEDIHSQHGTEFQKPYLTKQPDGTWAMRYGQCAHPACVQQVQAITDSQRGMPKRPDHALNPFRTYNSQAGDPPTESTQARKHGTITLSLDWNVMSESARTLADTLPDPVTDEGWNPYTTPDPEITNQIAWEQSARYSGPTTTYRRKINPETGKDFVAIDTWGRLPADTVIAPDGSTLPDEHADRLPSARCWYALALTDDPVLITNRELTSSDFEVAFIFETPKRIDYAKEVRYYQQRITESSTQVPYDWSYLSTPSDKLRWATDHNGRRLYYIIPRTAGHYPSYEEQRQMAHEAAQERLERKARRMTAPIDAQVDTDPFRYGVIDLDIHEPHEVIDVEHLIPIWAYHTRDIPRFWDADGNPMRITGQPNRTELEAKILSHLTNEDLTEIEQEITEYLRDTNRLHLVTLYHLRGHTDIATAQKTRLHNNGAEFLAHHEDAIKITGQSPMLSSIFTWQAAPIRDFSTSAR
jgi:hypothetical protein